MEMTILGGSDYTLRITNGYLLSKLDIAFVVYLAILSENIISLKSLGMIVFKSVILKSANM